MVPPKTKRKLGAIARGMIGQPRQCDSCDELKVISEATFTPTNRGERGWSTTCKVCQAHKASLAATSAPNADIRRRIEQTQSTDETIQRMYNLNFQGKHGEAQEVAQVLALRVRDLAEAGDRPGSFNLFIEIVKPLIAGWMEPGAIHDDIKRGLLSEHRRCLIIATRYSAKSTLTSIYVAWEIFLNEHVKIMVVSRGSKLAARMLRTVRRVFFANCPMLRHLEPNEDCLDNAEQFQVPQALNVATGGVTLTSLGMGSNLPGFRSDITIGDDVEGPQDDTPEKVVDLEEKLNELHMINPRGRKVMLGTYQSEFSVYAKLADLEDSDGNAVWELHRACMFEEDELEGKLVIHSRWPDMFSDDDAKDWRNSVTLRAWKLHAMLVADPSILHERPLKIGDLPVLEWDARGTEFPISLERTGKVLPELPRWSAPKGDEWFEARPQGDFRSPLAQIVMAVDPASGLAGRDAIGVAVLGVTEAGLGLILHLEGVRAHDKSVARKRVAEIGRDFMAQACVVEELADGLFGETLESDFVHLGYPMVVEKVTTGGQQKGRRIIESLGPPMGAGRIAILKSVVTTDHGGEFVNQLVRISYDGRTGSAKDHDDIVDALAHAVAKVKDSLISDIADNLAAARAAEIDRWARVPLRQGGLGNFDDEDFPQSRRFDTEPDFAERLLEEDEVVIALEERRDRLQAVVSEDIRFGRRPDQGMVQSITNLTKQINELQSLQVF